MATDAVGLDPNCSSAYRLANLLDGPIRTGQGWMSGEEFELEGATRVLPVGWRRPGKSPVRQFYNRPSGAGALIEIAEKGHGKHRARRTQDPGGDCRAGVARLLALGVRRSSSLRRIRDSSCEGLCILRDPIADWASRGINVLRSEMTDLSRSLCSSTSFHNEARRIETNLLDKSIDQYLRSID